MLRSLLVLLVLAPVARATPPSGYRCGSGKPNPGKGCTCPASTVDSRNADNHAICAPIARAVVSPCRKAGNAVREAARGELSTANDLKKIPANRLPAFLAAVASGIEKHCVADRWSAEAVSCFARAAVEDDLERCGKLLTAAQQRAAEQAMQALMTVYVKKDEPSGPTELAMGPTKEVEPLETKPGAAKRVVVTGDRIEIPDRVYFATSTATIQPRSFPILDAVAAVLAANPSIHVRVDGHTDSQGDDLANMKLSTRRADAVRVYLIKAGVAPGRLEAKGFGETRPIAPNITAANRAKNRRIELTVLSK